MFNIFSSKKSRSRKQAKTQKSNTSVRKLNVYTSNHGKKDFPNMYAI